MTENDHPHDHDHGAKIEKTRGQKVTHVFFKYVLPFLVAAGAIAADVAQIAGH